MIVSESDTLIAALDRRLQIDRVLALAPLSPDAGGSSTPRARTAAPPATAPASAPDPATRATVLARLPLGQLVSARVVDVPTDNHVIAEVGELRIALSWPGASGIVPQPGRDVVLRVLAHRPMLLFQSVDASQLDEPVRAPDNVHWSSDAMRLQAIAPSTAHPGTGAVRFDIPILEIEIDALPDRATDADDRDPRVDVDRGAVDRGVSSRIPAVVARSFETPAVALPTGGDHGIALDDVIVAHATAMIDGIETPLISYLPDIDVPAASPFMPLVLQGPAWPGQAMELVVRREREDEQFDNPALDHWCGEVVIDLPNLGRVAGHLSFSMQGLRLRIEGDDERGVEAMSAATAELAAALAHAELRVAGLTVAGPAHDATRSDWAGSSASRYGMTSHG